MKEGEITQVYYRDWWATTEVDPITLNWLDTTLTSIYHPFRLRKPQGYWSLVIAALANPREIAVPPTTHQ